MTRPVALITGAGRARGIGAAIARRLVRDGWNIGLTYWSEYDAILAPGVGSEEVQSQAEALRSQGAHVCTIEADLKQPSAAGAIVATVRESLGVIRSVILSHCECAPSGILDTTVESFDRHFAVNCRASWQLMQAMAAQVSDVGGSIVALTSDHTAGNLPYGASKGALDRMVLAAARELAHLRIRANLINPGPVDTGWMDDATRETLRKLQPSGRLGTAEDTANLVAFLLSEQGSWINGQLLHSDGGVSA